MLKDDLDRELDKALKDVEQVSMSVVMPVVVAAANGTIVVTAVGAM